MADAPATSTRRRRRALAEAYRLLRTVEHRLQLVDEQQVHTLPTDADALDRLARVLGHRDTPAGTAAEQFDARAAPPPGARCARSTSGSTSGRCSRRSPTGDGALSPEAAVARLKAFGFTDALRTQAAVRELTRGLNRSSRLMQQMLPLMLDWLSAVARPRPRAAAAAQPAHRRSSARPTLVEAFRESPEAAQRLCCIARHQPAARRASLARNPDLVGAPARRRTAWPPAPRAELVDVGRRAIVDGAPTARPSSRRPCGAGSDRNLLGIAARDLLGRADVHEVGRDLTHAGRGHRSRPRSTRSSPRCRSR